MNIDRLDIFRKSVKQINRYCTDPVLVLYDTVLQRSGKHIEGSGWIYDHSDGKTIWGMSLISAAVSEKEGIFPLNMDVKPTTKTVKGTEKTMEKKYSTCQRSQCRWL